MSLPLFETTSVNLSMKSSMGEQLTANVYTVEGVYNTDGSLRSLSIGQLVMAVCLNRAAELESEIISLMETLARQSANINALSKAQEKVLAKDGATTFSELSDNDVKLSDSESITYYKDDGTAVTLTTMTKAELEQMLTDLKVSYTASSTLDEVSSAIDSSLDSLNSFSQETLIDIQSKTTKRDDTYNLVANVTKSLGTTLTGIVNNYR